jgi:DNA-binding NtrC family response regulator
LANHGTLLLEEVDALSPYLQGRIALILQEGQVQRMKTTRARPVNFRLIVTASCPHDGQPMLSPALETAVQSHQLKVPPLRERRDDISLLGDQMLDELHREQLAPDRSEQRPHLTEEALRKLMAHTWPGNIAELSLVIREAHLRLRAPEHAIDAELIELRPVEPRTLADAEWTTIEKAMEHTRGNLSAAARVLGIDRTTLWRKLKKRSEVYQASSSS